MFRKICTFATPRERGGDNERHTKPHQEEFAKFGQTFKIYVVCQTRKRLRKEDPSLQLSH